MEFQSTVGTRWQELNTHLQVSQPDAYSVDGERQKTPKKQRLQHLISLVESHILTQPFEVKYLYYDTSNGWPVILLDPDYSNEFREMYVK
jgi:hypothetical protein